MSKYEPLKNYLVNVVTTGRTEVTLSFEELEGILLFPLCDSAHKYPSWWENDRRSHPQARAWLDAGWQCVDKDLVNKTVTFGVPSGLSKAQNAEPHSSYVRASEHKGVTGHTNLEKAKSPILVFSPCSKNKCEKPAEYIPNFTPVEPWRYLEDKEVLKRLMDTRKCILKDLGRRTGKEGVLAFDLYVRAGKAYKEIFHSYYKELRDKLIQNDDVQWFFISGGYGVIHALEGATKYNASFNNSRIAQIWREEGRLSSICDAIVEKIHPSHIYVFGGTTYTRLITEDSLWAETKSTKFFEINNMGGLDWLSLRLNELAKAILDDNLHGFDDKNPEKYYRQPRK